MDGRSSATSPLVKKDGNPGARSRSVGSEWEDSSVEADRKREDDAVPDTIKDAKLARPKMYNSESSAIFPCMEETPELSDPTVAVPNWGNRYRLPAGLFRDNFFTMLVRVMDFQCGITRAHLWPKRVHWRWAFRLLSFSPN